MAKGDDALARKRNRVRRKRMRSSENAVSELVAAIIANKRRRKSGKRRGCEGMCFSLPTPEDPFIIFYVIDGLKYFLDLNVSDKIFSIRDAISSSPQITIFTDSSDKNVATTAKILLRGRITKICINDLVSSRSAFVTQHVHFCSSDKLKTSKVKEILEQIMQSHAKKSSKVLLVTASDKKAQHLSSSLKLGNCTVTDGSHGNYFTICSSLGLTNVHVKDRENLVMTDVEGFETVLVVDFPPSVDEYVEILTGVACQTIGGEVHSILCNTDAPVAEPLAELLGNCSQVVPEFFKKMESS